LIARSVSDHYRRRLTGRTWQQPSAAPSASPSPILAGSCAAAMSPHRNIHWPDEFAILVRLCVLVDPADRKIGLQLPCRAITWVRTKTTGRTTPPAEVTRTVAANPGPGRVRSCLVCFIPVLTPNPSTRRVTAMATPHARPVTVTARIGTPPEGAGTAPGVPEAADLSSLTPTTFRPRARGTAGTASVERPRRALRGNARLVSATM
jgi:hypothetical protein